MSVARVVLKVKAPTRVSACHESTHKRPGHAAGIAIANALQGLPYAWEALAAAAAELAEAGPAPACCDRFVAAAEDALDEIGGEP